MIWDFPKIRGTFLGVPIIRPIVFWDLYWGPFILGNYHMSRGQHLCEDAGHVGPQMSPTWIYQLLLSDGYGPFCT